jgi:hypothetical protein
MKSKLTIEQFEYIVENAKDKIKQVKRFKKFFNGKNFVVDGINYEFGGFKKSYSNTESYWNINYYTSCEHGSGCKNSQCMERRSKADDRFKVKLKALFKTLLPSVSCGILYIDKDGEPYRDTMLNFTQTPNKLQENRFDDIKAEKDKYKNLIEVLEKYFSKLRYKEIKYKTNFFDEVRSTWIKDYAIQLNVSPRKMNSPRLILFILFDGYGSAANNYLFNKMRLYFNFDHNRMSLYLYNENLEIEKDEFDEIKTHVNSDYEKQSLIPKKYRKEP